MTPQEKAKELVELFWTEVEDNNYATRKMSLVQAKQCALLAVDKVLKECSWELTGYWMSVKQEIENL
jgi:hypothetical protein